MQRCTPSFASPLVVAAVVVVAVVVVAGCGGAGISSDPRASHLRINEVMPANAASCVDGAGEADDWLELFNDSDADIDLDGVSITDDRTTPDKFALDGLTVPAGGVLLLWADDTVAQGTDHLPFKLSAAAEEVLLFIGEGQVDEVTWTGAVADVGLGRFPDGSGEPTLCASSSCGDVNGAACE